ncbi:hypothetical protein SteCoe_15915 [Stentor coeruleus]|uniref:protein-disulfide reductase n=1 Tax=Stentor coeruleus TaxID=5963 RepID=A0A1R2C2J6_9CILI|nr:hypothetical protein SteCoe_15915 [Stentor coeruleus]
MQEIFGETLLSHNGPVEICSITSTFKLIYFSAQWCHPCKQFTSQLVLFYNEVNRDQKQVEVIFVSYDKNISHFDDDFATMPWLALPYEDRIRAEIIGNQYGAKVVPMLILIDDQGKMISDNCRADVVLKGPVCLGEWQEIINK